MGTFRIAVKGRGSGKVLRDLGRSVFMSLELRETEGGDATPTLLGTTFHGVQQIDVRENDICVVTANGVPVNINFSGIAHKLHVAIEWDEGSNAPHALGESVFVALELSEVKGGASIPLGITFHGVSAGEFNVKAGDIRVVDGGGDEVYITFSKPPVTGC